MKWNKEFLEWLNDKFYYSLDDVNKSFYFGIFEIEEEIILDLAVRWLDTKNIYLKTLPLLYVLPEELVFECEIFKYSKGFVSNTHKLNEYSTRNEAIKQGVIKGFELLGDSNG